MTNFRVFAYSIHTVKIFFLLLCATVPILAQTIENERYIVRRAEDGAISIASKSPQRSFLKNARLNGEGGTARIVPVQHKIFGPGQSMEITHANTGRASVMLFPNLPFVLVDPMHHEDAIIKEATTFSGVVEGNNLKTFGTGGLLAPDKNPGSYAWQAVVDPATGNGAVFGWITHDRGSGVLFTKPENQNVRVEAKVQYGRLRASPGLSLETFAIGYFDDARLGLEAWAGAVAKNYAIRLKPQPTGYCTWYSRPNGGASDEKHLAELAEFSAQELAPYGFSVVQIDDKWQAGYSTNGPKRDFMQHAPKGPYPTGMKAAADHIKSLGLTPGIWFMPFAGTFYDPAFKERQDWFVKNATNNQPYETSWGGTCLDMTQPAAKDYVRNLARRIVGEWGYTYFKVDGLWTGTATKQQYVNSGYKDDGMGDAVFHDPKKTNIEAYRDGLKTLREGAGENVFILGCNGPQNMRSYAGAFGLVDAMRVGPDNGAEWSRLTRGPVFGSRHYFLHGRVWWNDPDPVYVRESMPLKHAQLICSWVAISGQLNLSSEWLPGLPKERLDILKRTMPSHLLQARPADLFENDPPRYWSVHENDRHIIALFNWSDRDEKMEYPVQRLDLDPTATYDAFDYWQNVMLSPITHKVNLSVPGQSCRVIALRKKSNEPQVLSTSRHVTQGLIDLRDEKWSGDKKELTGRARVVANDPYELRVTGMKPTSARASDGATANVKSADGLTRIILQSSATREVNWTLRFD
jgi:hypothetical protein